MLRRSILLLILCGILAAGVLAGWLLGANPIHVAAVLLCGVLAGVGPAALILWFAKSAPADPAYAALCPQPEDPQPTQADIERAYNGAGAWYSIGGRACYVVPNAPFDLLGDGEPIEKGNGWEYCCGEFYYPRQFRIAAVEDRWAGLLRRPLYGFDLRYLEGRA